MRSRGNGSQTETVPHRSKSDLSLFIKGYYKQPGLVKAIICQKQSFGTPDSVITTLLVPRDSSCGYLFIFIILILINYLGTIELC
jgi:hypothetical protein